MRNVVPLILLAGAALAAPASAQGADSAAIDRIVAVVGNRPILESQVVEQLYAALRGQDLPNQPEVLRSLRKTILSDMIDRELVVQAALKDTAIKVTDDEVTQSVDELYRNVRGRYPSEEAFRRELNKTGFNTLEEWRSHTADLQRREFLWSRFWEQLEARGEIKPIPPTDEEVREEFESKRLTYPKRAEAVSFQQIVLSPRPSEAELAKAKAQADSILVELRNGADFANAARRWSGDPGSKEQGGSIGWIRRGQGLEPAFEEAAFSQRPGQVSNPVETSYGFHLIQVERVQPAEVSVRHILISAGVDSAQADSARLLAESIYRAAKAGASFDSLQRLHHDRGEERDVSQYPLDRLPPGYATALQGVAEGDVAPIFQLEAPDPNRSKYVIVKVTTRVPAGDVRFEDVRDQIRAGLSRQLARQRYLEKMREANFVEIRQG
ncbi:MAG: peptidylprolyl isomerase [Gemmatimonadales bacterium]